MNPPVEADPWLGGMLKAAARLDSTRCPGSTEAGCRCTEHHPGLRAYSPDPEAFDEQVPREVRLNVVTLGEPLAIPCTGSMTCPCAKCVGDRQTAMERQRMAKIAQPWAVRPSRRIAA